MTEAQWLTCADPGAMLQLLGATPNKRKMRLFGLACCRRVEHFSLPEHAVSCCRALVAWDRFCDWLVADVELADAWAEMGAVAMDAAAAIAHPADARFHASSLAAAAILSLRETGSAEAAEHAATAMANWVLAKGGIPALDAIAASWKNYSCTTYHPVSTPQKWAADEAAVVQLPAFIAAREKERQHQCAILRDLFGNPFRPAQIERAWLGWENGRIIKAAFEAYSKGRYQDLSMIGQMLQKAGCGDEEILGHCRAAGPHVKGCWVIDGLIGKTV